MTLLRPIRHLVLLGLPMALAAAQEPALAIRGTVSDSVHRGPLAGARVVAARTAAADDPGAAHEFRAITDANGRFDLKPLPPDVYLLTVEHPWLDSTGFAVPPQTVDLRDGRSASIDLAVPSGATIRAAFCPRATARDSTLGLVEGVVRDAESDVPLNAVHVLFEWTDFTVDRHTGRATAHHHTVIATSARDGSYTVCGVPVRQAFLMQAQIGEHIATGAVQLEIPPGGVLVRTLRIESRAAGDSTAGPLRGAPVAGEVLRAGSQRPIPGAHVHVFGVDGDVVTAEDGSFHLRDVPLGTQSIEVTALGLSPQRYAIDVLAGGEQQVNIVMSERPVALDTVRTIIRRNGADALRDEFDNRVAHGPGQYITEATIARLQPWKTSDVIRYVRGFQLSHDTVYSSRGEYDYGALATCRPLLMIDGSPADSMDEVLPISIHGIEIYASSMNVPIKYSATATATGCGAIFIWTK